MAAAATLVLKNAADVNVNFFPVRIRTGEEAVYVDRTNAVLSLQGYATLSYRENATNRIVSTRVTHPVLQADGTVVTGYHTSEARIPKLFGLTDRQELRKRELAMLGDAIYVAAVDNGETPW